MQKKDPGNEVVGTISLTGSGIGYVVTDERDGDIAIDAHFLRTALHKDTVRVRILTETKDGAATGEVIAVLHRAKQGFTGTLRERDQVYYVVPNDPKMEFDIIIPPGKQLDAAPGDKVFTTITHWDDRREPPIGRIDVRLGLPGENEAEMRGIALERGFTSTFPEAVEQEAADHFQAGIPTVEYAQRRDLRSVPTCTIDPADAKDFDDALSLEHLENGNIAVGVHIADVSHYVTEGSKLDEEAYERATSVYLVDRTIPMLPEVLSNDLCSLRPNEDRLAFSVIFEITPTWKIVDTWIGRTIINSNRRFTYEEAQDCIEGAKDPLTETIQLLNTIAQHYGKKRINDGALVLDQEEVSFTLNADGKPIAVAIKERTDSHRMIEEWMLLANKAIAQFGAGEKATARERVFLYRVHDTPDREKMNDLAVFLRKLGHSIHLRDGIIPSKTLNHIIEELHGHPEKDAIENLIVRSMAKAVYAIENIGHYGLGFSFYTHFTSPIRRYPDLLVHRLITARLNQNRTPDTKRSFYQKAAQHCSDRERDAQDAERSSVKYKQVEYMADHVGKSFDGVVTSITSWGMFVEEQSTKAEGLIRLRDLGNEYFIFDEKTLSLHGKKSGTEYRIGTKLRITVTKVNLEEKLIDYALV